ncbi:hypothetical protein ABT103_31565, partial [Streptomyces sp. NPDC002122]
RRRVPALDDVRPAHPAGRHPGVPRPAALPPLSVLTRYFELTDDPRLPELIATAGRWIADRTDTRSTRPGLHFGGRGTAWALYDAGRAVDDRALIDHALALALAPQESTPSRDITHGSAGSGMAAVRLWHRTGGGLATLIPAASLGTGYQTYLFPGMLMMTVQTPAIMVGTRLITDRQSGRVGGAG